VSCALFVHAHPDDETIATGATMARYADEGADVALVTCTRGEEGEVIPPSLCYLEDDRDGGLAPYRVAELREALTALGVENHWYLDDLVSAAAGAQVRYRDSGMVGTPPNADPRAFASAPVDPAASALARLVERLEPDAVVTYDPQGGYGHPDHVQTHRVTMRALELSRFTVPRTYWVAVPRSIAEGSEGRSAATSVVVDDALVTTAVDGSAYLDRKIAALRAHATQVDVDPPRFALSNGVWQSIASTEYFRLVAGRTRPPYDTEGRETSLL
jgi:N-acetyl-1-D-myo-inositol-2-amino-2-deoxy-alpha-D-glucopyranoside deacetylase